MNRHKSDHAGEIASRQLLHHDFQMVQCDEYMAQEIAHELDQTMLPKAHEHAAELTHQRIHRDYP